jgi:hypothetical protein
MSAASQGSIVGVVEPRIQELLAAGPTMPATVIAERVGWTRGLTVLKQRVRDLRPACLPPDRASRAGLDRARAHTCHCQRQAAWQP